MYVCICNALSEKKVREAARTVGGRATGSELFRCLGAAPQCGKCVSFALDVFRDECQRGAAA